MIHLNYKMNIIKKEEEQFPWRLRVLGDCPDILYALGNINILNDFSIAVVGSRLCDDYGKAITEKIVKELVRRGICIVSGLAEGIDTVAHVSALEQHGKTIAVIGNGFEDIYPPGNHKLVDKIISQGGAIISEYLPDQIPLKYCFPQRNRLVACMTEGTIVTQARSKSGALITADFARKYSKKLFAFPGDITNKKCDGSNELIKNGAKFVLNVEDILKEYPNYKYTLRNIIEKPQKKIMINEEYKHTYNLINESETHISEICRNSCDTPQHIMTDLTMLEIDGFIESLPGGYYKKRNFV